MYLLHIALVVDLRYTTTDQSISAVSAVNQFFQVCQWWNAVSDQAPCKTLRW